MGRMTLLRDDGEVATVRLTSFVTSFMESKIPSVQDMRRNALLSLDQINTSVWKTRRDFYFKIQFEIKKTIHSDVYLVSMICISN